MKRKLKQLNKLSILFQVNHLVTHQDTQNTVVYHQEDQDTKYHQLFWYFVIQDLDLLVLIDLRVLKPGDGHRHCLHVYLHLDNLFWAKLKNRRPARKSGITGKQYNLLRHFSFRYPNKIVLNTGKIEALRYH